MTSGEGVDFLSSCVQPLLQSEHIEDIPVVRS